MTESPQARGGTRACYLTPYGVFDLDDPAADAPTWAAWCKAHPNQQVEVWVHGQWLVEVHAPVSKASSESTARQELLDAYGPEAAEWPMAAWRLGTAAGYTALPMSLLAETRSTAARHGVRVRSLAPWWAYQVGFAEVAWGKRPNLVVQEGTRLNCLQATESDAGGLVIRWQAGTNSSSATSPLPTSLRAGSPRWIISPTDLGKPRPSLRASHWSRAAAAFWKPPQWANERQDKLTVSWALATVSILMAGVSVWSAAQTWEDLQRQTQQGPKAATASSASVGSSKTAAAETAALTSAKRANDLALRLQHPWNRFFDGLEAAGVKGWQWISAEHDSSHGAIHAEAWSEDAASIQSLVDTLTKASWADVAPLAVQALPAPAAGVQTSVSANVRAAAVPAHHKGKH